MDILADFSLEVTVWIQNHYPQLEQFLKGFSATGKFEFYLLIITLVYWCLEKRLGRSLIYVLTFSYAINTVLKHFFADVRPYWSNPEIGLENEKSYGIPSGHAQGATVFYGLIAMWADRIWVWLLAIALVAIMSLSRVYLGVHDLEDVVAGIFLGVLILIGYYFWQRYLAIKFANRILGQRLLVAVLIPLSLAIIYAIVLLLLGQPDYQVPWSDRIDIAENKSYRDFATAFGLLIGLGIGFILEVSRIRFKVEGPLWKRMVRYLLGLGVTILLWMGLGSFIPDEPLILSVPLNILISIVGGLWVSFYAPWLFVRLQLADSRPEPEVSLTV
ncbi:MAG TPA: phosphatase PAP2 family protein [Patescibacteria group bacterium]|jgi:membrane-associated phospholipid phosphatase|nr:phosphatase PAP2 family protein [Patescibacteria group bacterium]